jgi:hypothetical protein
MSAPFRYLQRHPILCTLGVLGTVLFCVMGFLLLTTLLLQLAALVRGNSHTDAVSLAATIIAEFFMLSWIAWYVNMWAVFTRLKRLDPMAYDLATREMGFIALIWSSRSAPVLLHRSLGSLTLAEYPPGFRRWVKMTRTANRLLLMAFGVVTLGGLAALVASYIKGH